MRFFVEISYNGTAYSGWQRQPNAMSIQEKIEDALSTILQKKTSIVGCGRTDAGVHAYSSFFHFDHADIVSNLVYKLNLILPKDISIKRVINVNDDAHARFDATSRAYIYKLHIKKDPFLHQRSYYFPQGKDLDLELMNKAAESLLSYSKFFPFCKTRTDVKTMNCKLSACRWEFDDDKYTLHITSDRFLRGMVRLIVGMCINVSLDKLTLDAVMHAMENQERLERDLSVPACGLYLSKIKYPYIDMA